LSHAALGDSIDLARQVFEDRADAYKAATFRSTFQVPDLTHRLIVHSSLADIFRPFITDVMIECKIIWASFAVKQPSGPLSYLDLHQDVSMCDLRDGRPAATAWIPLQDTHDAIGGISVVPKREYFNTTPRGYGQAGDWEDARAATLRSNAVALNVGRGQALFFHQALLHCSGGNFGPTVRVAVMLILLPREKRTLVYRCGSRLGQVVPDDFYVRQLMKVR
jgi:hypothetical protein